MHYYGGLSLGLLKPVYLEVQKTGENNEVFFAIERYDPDIHSEVDIFGNASFGRGLDKTKWHPGLYAKVGSSFDYSFHDNKVLALEVGVIFDYFPDKVPIMATEKNYNLLSSIYMTLSFGKKWN